MASIRVENPVNDSSLLIGWHPPGFAMRIEPKSRRDQVGREDARVRSNMYTINETVLSIPIVNVLRQETHASQVANLFSVFIDWAM